MAHSRFPLAALRWVMRLLFGTSEAHPLIKTGGLADVSGSLPPALHRAGVAVRLVLPGYPQVLEALPGLVEVGRLRLTPGGEARILAGTLPGSDCPLWVLDLPRLFARGGGPYVDHHGWDWEDNGERFGVFSRALAELALDRAGLGWRADVLHCNDWQTGLAAAWVHGAEERPRTVFTIHNLAYQGIFPRSTFDFLGLPGWMWEMGGLEFHGNCAFIKGGLAFADRLTTVSPSYAREICDPVAGRGLDGLLRHRSADLCGIVNGIDDALWNPAADPALPACYSAADLSGKAVCKAGLRGLFGLPERPGLLLGMVSRLVEQKGIGLFLGALEALCARDVQIVLQGSGEQHLVDALEAARARWPDRLALHIGYSEARAHLVEAGADAFLMPSLYEPCGLNQLYSLRYGTPPIVRATGGLADTVVDAGPAQRAAGTANGFTFFDPSPAALLSAVDRALGLFAQPEEWRKLQRAGMGLDLSWRRSAERYLALYEELLA